jgi:radical SAM protein with 4Fe4S-binding SPASM domain
VERFYETFGDIADGVFVEHVMSCWPDFDFESNGVKINPELGIYGQPVSEVNVCPYIFYEFAINSNGTVSACFLDWERKLIVGDTKTQSVKEIWNGIQMRTHQMMMLRGERKTHPVCHNCGQLTHGRPDNIDLYSQELLKKLEPIR